MDYSEAHYTTTALYCTRGKIRSAQQYTVPGSTYWLFFLADFSFLFLSHLLSSPFLFISILVVTRIWGHISGSSPPLRTTVRASHIYREKIPALSSLVDSRRIVPTHAGRSQHLVLFSILQKFKISPRRDSNSRTNTSSIQGLPRDHRGNRHAAVTKKIPVKNQLLCAVQSHTPEWPKRGGSENCQG